MQNFLQTIKDDSENVSSSALFDYSVQGTVSVTKYEGAFQFNERDLSLVSLLSVKGNAKDEE